VAVQVPERAVVAADQDSLPGWMQRRSQQPVALDAVPLPAADLVEEGVRPARLRHRLPRSDQKVAETS
jgi:hypothetical protein